MSAPTPLLDRALAPRPWPPPAAAPAPPPPAARPDPPRATIRQLVVGLIALPLSLLPFLAYATFTPEGRLIRDRVRVALSPPVLPDLSAAARTAAVAAAPSYEGAVMALAYHGIGSASDGEGGFVVSPERFGEHLATLKAAGMHTVTAPQVADAFAGGAPLPPNAVLVTFDDGRADAMMFADPLLEQAGMVATMFVIADAASAPGVYYASWDKVESYARSGRWDIQSHTTASHREHKADGGGSLPMLTSRAPGETIEEYRERVREDLDDAGDAIENRLGRRPVAFAYPFGAYGADRTNDPAIRQVLAEEVRRQYALAFHQDEQESIPLLDPTSDRLGLRRLEVGNWSGIELLERIHRAQVIRDGMEPAPQPAPGADAAETADTVPPTTAIGGTTPPTTAAPAGARPGATGAATPPAATPAPAAPAVVSVPPATSPPVTATVPPVTSPPVTSAPPGPVVTSPPTTRPPTTSPPTTAAPPTTSPPTTTCTPVGNSGKCPPGKG